MKFYIHAAEDDKYELAKTSKDPNVLVELFNDSKDDLNYDNKLILRTIAGNPNTPSNILSELFTMADKTGVYDRQETDCNIAGNPNTPVEILKQYIDNSNLWIRYYLASNPNLPNNFFNILAQDSEKFVRQKIAGNPNTPVEILIELAEDEDEDTRKYAISNSNFPKEIDKDKLVPMKKESKSINDKVWLEYNVDANDPADWYIDYDEFFEIIDSVLDDLNIDVENYDEEETRGGRICTYELSNGKTIDSYDLEIELLNDLYDDKVDDTEIYQYVKKYLKKYK